MNEYQKRRKARRIAARAAHAKDFAEKKALAESHGLELEQRMLSAEEWASVKMGPRIRDEFDAGQFAMLLAIYRQTSPQESFDEFVNGWYHESFFDQELEFWCRVCVTIQRLEHLDVREVVQQCIWMTSSPDFEPLPEIDDAWHGIDQGNEIQQWIERAFGQTVYLVGVEIADTGKRVPVPMDVDGSSGFVIFGERKTAQQCAESALRMPSATSSGVHESTWVNALSRMCDVLETADADVVAFFYHPGSEGKLVKLNADKLVKYSFS